MEKEEIELRSEKVRHIMGRMPGKLVVFAILIYACVLLLILLVVHLLDIEIGENINRLLGI